MACAADEDEKSEKNGAKAGAETRVVVSSALPDGEAIREEMIVARALRALEEFLYETETRKAV